MKKAPPPTVTNVVYNGDVADIDTGANVSTTVYYSNGEIEVCPGFQFEYSQAPGSCPSVDRAPDPNGCYNSGFDCLFSPLIDYAPAIVIGVAPFLLGPEGAVIDAAELSDVTAVETADSAYNVVNGIRLAGDLNAESSFAAFTSDGNLASALVNMSDEVIPGSKLGNKALINELTSDGSSIDQWGKYETPTLRTPDGAEYKIHFYKNNVTGEVNYNFDYKAKMNGFGPPGFKVPISINSFPIEK